MAENEMDRKTRILVECYSGFKANERPISFEAGEGRRIVVNVIDQWIGEDHNYFKLLADDRKVYMIRYDRHGDFWTLEKIMEPLGKH